MRSGPTPRQIVARENGRLGGRPAKPANEIVRTKARQFGRVDDKPWSQLQEAAKAAGKTFTSWALAHLIAAAKREAAARAKAKK